MAIKFNEQTGLAEVVADKMKRGPKRQVRPQESALQSIASSPEALSQSVESTGDSWLDAITSVTRYLGAASGDLSQLDDIVLQELQKLGYTKEDLEKDPFLHRTTLQQIREQLEHRRTHYANEMGQYGGTGSVGEYTINKAGDGHRLRSGTKISK